MARQLGVAEVAQPEEEDQLEEEAVTRPVPAGPWRSGTVRVWFRKRLRPTRLARARFS